MALSCVRLRGCCARGWSSGGGCSGRRSCSGSSSSSFRGWRNSGGGCHCSGASSSSSSSGGGTGGCIRGCSVWGCCGCGCGCWLWFWGWIISRSRTRLGLLNHRGLGRVICDLALQLTNLRRLLVLHKHTPFHSQACVTVCISLA